MLRIVPVNSRRSISQAQNLFREYGSIPGVEDCVVNFEREILSLPGVYAPPAGRLFLATCETANNIEEAAGCIGLRGLEPAKNICKLNRLYVRRTFRGQGVGRKLMERSIEEARSIGYSKIILDTLAFMVEAHKLYASLGFREIPTYEENPYLGALYFELALS